MNAYANADLRMPAHYTDMSEKEMEYDGGFLHFLSAVSLICAAASCGVTIAQKAGIIDQNCARNATVTLGVVGTVTGVVSGVGILWTGGAGLSAGSALMAFTGITADPAMSFANAVIHW